MSLVAVVLILIVWAALSIHDVSQPKLPPIEDTQEHLRKIQSLPNAKARQKYLRDLAKGKIKE